MTKAIVTQDTKDKKTLNVELIAAVTQNEPEKVQTLLDSGADVNVRDENNCPVLIIAAREGYHDVLQRLIKFNADVTITANLGLTAMHVAANANHGEIVKSLLEQNVNPNIRDGFGSTALFIAIKCGYLEIVKQLLFHEDIDLKLTNILNDNALEIAKKWQLSQGGKQYDGIISLLEGMVNCNIKGAGANKQPSFDVHTHKMVVSDSENQELIGEESPSDGNGHGYYSFFCCC